MEQKIKKKRTIRKIYDKKEKYEHESIYNIYDDELTVIDYYNLYSNKVQSIDLLKCFNRDNLLDLEKYYDNKKETQKKNLNYDINYLTTLYNRRILVSRYQKQEQLITDLVKIIHSKNKYLSKTKELKLFKIDGLDKKTVVYGDPEDSTNIDNLYSVELTLPYTLWDKSSMYYSSTIHNIGHYTKEAWVRVLFDSDNKRVLRYYYSFNDYIESLRDSLEQRLQFISTEEPSSINNKQIIEKNIKDLYKWYTFIILLDKKLSTIEHEPDTIKRSDKIRLIDSKKKIYIKYINSFIYKKELESLPLLLEKELKRKQEYRSVLILILKEFEKEYYKKNNAYRTITLHDLLPEHKEEGEKILEHIHQYIESIKTEEYTPENIQYILSKRKELLYLSQNIDKRKLIETDEEDKDFIIHSSYDGYTLQELEDNLDQYEHIFSELISPKSGSFELIRIKKEKYYNSRLKYITLKKKINHHIVSKEELDTFVHEYQKKTSILWKKPSDTTIIKNILESKIKNLTGYLTSGLTKPEFNEYGVKVSLKKRALSSVVHLVLNYKLSIDDKKDEYLAYKKIRDKLESYAESLNTFNKTVEQKTRQLYFNRISETLPELLYQSFDTNNPCLFVEYDRKGTYYSVYAHQRYKDCFPVPLDYFFLQNLNTVIPVYPLSLNKKYLSGTEGVHYILYDTGTPPIMSTYYIEVMYPEQSTTMSIREGVLLKGNSNIIRMSFINSAHNHITNITMYKYIIEYLNRIKNKEVFYIIKQFVENYVSDSYFELILLYVYKQLKRISIHYNTVLNPLKKNILLYKKQHATQSSFSSLFEYELQRIFPFNTYTTDNIDNEEIKELVKEENETQGKFRNISTLHPHISTISFRKVYITSEAKKILSNFLNEYPIFKTVDYIKTGLEVPYLVLDDIIPETKSSMYIINKQAIDNTVKKRNLFKPTDDEVQAVLINEQRKLVEEKRERKGKRISPIENIRITSINEIPNIYLD